MGISVKIENMSVIFGTKLQQQKALELIEQGLSVHDIKEQTKATVANKRINLDIKENELFVIVGLSGSGKSTLIRTLNLLNQPNEGTITVNHQPIQNYDTNELRTYRRNVVSMIFQHFGLFSHRSVLDNVAYPLEIQGIDKETRYERAKEYIDKVGLSGWEHYLPKQLSGGMRQRVGLARALTNEPQLLLMDEPYSALDPLIRREMQKELLSLEEDIERTIVFITHDMNEAFKIGDRIALMKDGEVIQVGTPLQFFNEPANQYVKDFIADVDKSRIYKVKDIMREINNYIYDDYQLVDAIQFMKEKQLEACYIVNREHRLEGYVLLKDLLLKSTTSLQDKLIKDGYATVFRNDGVQDILSTLQSANYDVPVIDIKRRFRGMIGYEDVIKALAS